VVEFNLISIKICPCEGEKGFFYSLNGDENLAAGLFAVTSINSFYYLLVY
jgi:hypothetical protein